MIMDHFPDLQRMHQNERFMAYLGGLRTDATTLEYLERNVGHWDEHGFGIWILRDPETAEIIGRGGLRHVEVNGVDEVEIGYAFFPEHWGRGLATELAIACGGMARDSLGLDSVVADATADNAASIRVMLKAGFEYEQDITIRANTVVLYRKILRKPADRHDRT